MRLNTGQCIPLTAIVQDCVDYIDRHGLDPATTVLWLFEANISCNIRLFPTYSRLLLASHGRGMEAVAIFLGDVTFFDMSVYMVINIYFANLFGGMLRKMACKIRPYEKEKGLTDRVCAEALAILHDVFEIIFSTICISISFKDK